jgi:transposase
VVHGGAVLALNFTPSNIDELNDLRFHHPDPIVMKRCETVDLKAKKLKTGQMHELTGFDVKTVRSHWLMLKNGGIEALKHREPYRPQGELDEHKLSIEQEFRERPPASIKEAGERIFKLTGIRRSDTRVEVFVKRLGMTFRKTGGVPTKADLAAQEDFLKKAGILGKTGIGRQVAFVFHGCGSLRLGNRFFDKSLVFHANVRSNVEWSQTLQRAWCLQRDHAKVVDGGERFVYQFGFGLRNIEVVEAEPCW